MLHCSSGSSACLCLFKSVVELLGGLFLIFKILILCGPAGPERGSPRGDLQRAPPSQEGTCRVDPSASDNSAACGTSGFMAVFFLEVVFEEARPLGPAAVAMARRNHSGAEKKRARKEKRKIEKLNKKLKRKQAAAQGEGEAPRP